MNRKIILALAVASICLSAGAVADNYNARVAGMGGTGVASSNYDTATSTNPALLTVFSESDDVSIIIPSFGIEGSDRYDIIDAVDDVPDLFDELDVAIATGDIAGANGFKDDILTILETVDGNHLRGNAGTGFSVSIPSNTVSMAISASANVDIGIVIMYEGGDEAVIDNAISTGNLDRLDDIESFGLAIGAIVKEASFSFAKEFETGGYRYSLGVSPKYQEVETILYMAAVSDIDRDEIDSDDYTNKESNFGLDIGAALFLNEHVTIGLNVKDAISNEYETNDLFGFVDTYELNPVVTTGIAYKTAFFTAALDIDLTETKGFKSVDNSQMIRVGAELDAWGWAQIRVGYRHDLEDTRDDVATLGLGFSLFHTMHFGLTGLVGENDTYGGSLEMKYTF